MFFFFANHSHPGKVHFIIFHFKIKFSSELPKQSFLSAVILFLQTSTSSNYTIGNTSCTFLILPYLCHNCILSFIAILISVRAISPKKISTTILIEMARQCCSILQHCEPEGRHYFCYVLGLIDNKHRQKDFCQFSYRNSRSKIRGLLPSSR